MKSFKKSILNVCNKIILTTTTSTSSVKPVDQPTNLVLKRKPIVISHRAQSSSSRPVAIRHKPTTTTTPQTVSPSIASSSSSSEPHHSYETVIMPTTTSSTSSGYGTSSTTSVEPVLPTPSTLSVFVNLDNYFYDENFSKFKDRAHESALEQKRHVVQCLLDYEAGYLERMRREIEKNVRPLSVLINERVYFEIFQNIEKICSITAFIKKTIDDSMLLTMDIYKSTLTVIHEYISIIVTAYELYIRGYSRAVELLENGAIQSQLSPSDFNPLTLIQLPIDHITKLYAAFSSLLDMTQLVDQDDYDKLNTVCATLKNLLSAGQDLVFTESDDEEENYEQDALDNVQIECEDEATRSSANDDDEDDASYSALTDDLVDESNVDGVREATVIANRCLVDKRVQARTHKPQSSLPSDYTDYDGYKHYFV